MDAGIATAVVRFRLDVHFGDPVTPAPQMMELPSLRPDTAPVRVLGYPLETVLAENLATAIMLGEANTRVRDYADVHTLTGRHDVTHHRSAPPWTRPPGSTASRSCRCHRSSTTSPSCASRTYRAYRTALGVDGADLPADFDEVVDAVTTFVDPLARPTAEQRWHAAGRRWIAST